MLTAVITMLALLGQPAQGAAADPALAAPPAGSATPDPLVQVRETWAAIQHVEARKATPRSERLATARAFAEAAEMVPVDAWTLPRDADLLRNALVYQAGQFLLDRPERAQAAAERLLALFPTASVADDVRRFHLPVASVLAEQPAIAATRVRAMAVIAKPELQPDLRLWEARAWAMAGDVPSARAACELAIASLPATIGETDPRAFVKATALRELALLGAPFRVPADPRWLGTAPAPPPPGVPQVIVVSATWCLPCLDELVALDDFVQREHPRIDLRVFLVEFERGYLPSSRTEPQKGQRVEDLTPEAFQDHVRKYVEVLGLRLAVATVERAAARDLGVDSYPSLRLRGEDGTIAFAPSAVPYEVIFKALRLAAAR